MILFVSTACFAQMDYRIDNARKVKMGYRPLPKDMQLSKLSWTDLDATCIDQAAYGAWFDLKVKSDRAQFTVHTGGRMGDIENPKIYLGRVKESKRGRSIEEICCVAHEGNDGEFSLECTDLSADNEYFVLVTSDQEQARFAISANDDFTPTKKTVVQEKDLSMSVFGRVVDKDGDGKSNIEVSILDDGQAVLSSVFTDDRGAFIFKKLKPEQVYMARVEADDTELQVDMFLVGGDGSIKSRSTRIGDRLYGFGVDKDLSKYIRLLSPEQYALGVPEGKRGIAGRVVDKQTYLFGRENVEVGLFNKANELMTSSTTDKNGVFSFVVDEGEDYAVQVKSDKEKDYTEIVMVDDMDVSVKVANSDDMDANGMFSFRSLPQEMITLKRMEVEDTELKLPSNFNDMEKGATIVLNNILFSSGSADLLPSSFVELNDLAEQLNKQPKVRIRVSGHTDNQGTSSTNMVLSEGRAKAVVEYLESQGVNTDRMTFKGYGETKPVAPNDTEEGRKKNRRVEFLVIE